MGRSSKLQSNQAITSSRAARLYRFLVLTSDTPKSRNYLQNRLKVDVRGFYRDLELLRELGVNVELDREKYHLGESLDSATSKLPFPDPGLSLSEALQLSQGRTEAHKKLRTRIDNLIGTNGRATTKKSST
jgi:predicted DNA-binding transcriptional regulator YafY